MTKRILHFLSLILGLIGIVVCVAAMVTAWAVAARIEKATRNVVDEIDTVLASVDEHVERTQVRVKELKITSDEIEKDIQNWAQAKASERAISRLQIIEEKSDRLASGLDQADRWLEATESSLQVTQRLLAAGQSFGVPIENELTDRLLGEVASVRGNLRQLIDRVDSVRTRLAEEETADGASRRQQLVSLTARLVATVTQLDSRLGGLRIRLQEYSEIMKDVKAKVTWWVRFAAIGIAVLIGWMAAGQVALCHVGWRGIRGCR